LSTPTPYSNSVSESHKVEIKTVYNLQMKEVGYGALFDAKDRTIADHALKVRLFARRINSLRTNMKWFTDKNAIISAKQQIAELESQRNNLVDIFNNDLERSYEDRSALKFEPIQIERTADIMTVRGISILANIMGGQSEQLFQWNAVGTSNQAESPADTKLIAEIDRVWMVTDGFVSPSSNSITYEGIFSPSLGSAAIYENGIFSDSDVVNSVMLLRSVFPTPLNHTQGQTIPVFSQLIYLKVVQ